MKASKFILTLAAMCVLTYPITVYEDGESAEQVVLEENTIEETVENTKENENITVELEAKPFIVDLDFCTDVDDACAVRVATSLDKQGVIELKAMMLCTTGENNVEALNGILTYDGYGALPIGTSAYDIPDVSPYWNLCSQYKSPEINKENSTTLYRKILANSDKKITIVTTGYLSNIKALLESQPDSISDKNGVELVQEKVEALYITGGSYTEGYDNNFWFVQEARDGLMSVVKNCRAPYYLITNNNGAPIKCGGLIQQVDVNRVDPISKSLDAFGTSDGRAAWDPMSVWIAALPMEQTRTTLEFKNMSFDVSTGFIQFGEDKAIPNVPRIQRIDDNYDWYRTQLDELLVYDKEF